MCTVASHEQLKLDRNEYLAATKPSGVQIFDDEEGHLELELRQCLRCGSTLCMVLEGELH